MKLPPAGLARSGRDVREVLATLRLRPSRRLGQNFLIDPNLADALVRELDVPAGTPVVEIGPGLGALTAALLAAGARPVISVERDRRLAAWLAEVARQEDLPLRVTAADFLRLGPADLELDSGTGAADPARAERLLAAGNLPYAQATPLVMHLVTAFGNRIAAAQLMLQREMAERLAAGPGTAAYGAPSVRLQLGWQVRITRRVPPEVFHPRPEVESAVVRIEPLAQPLLAPADVELRHAVATLVTTGFGQRRKRLAGLIRSRWSLSTAAADAALAAAGLAANARAEEVPPAGWVALARALGIEPPRPPHRCPEGRHGRLAV